MRRHDSVEQHCLVRNQGCHVTNPKHSKHEKKKRDLRWVVVDESVIN